MVSVYQVFDCVYVAFISSFMKSCSFIFSSKIDINFQVFCEILTTSSAPPNAAVCSGVSVS